MQNTRFPTCSQYIFIAYLQQKKRYEQKTRFSKNMLIFFLNATRTESLLHLLKHLKCNKKTRQILKLFFAMANVATNSHIHFLPCARCRIVLNFSVKKTFRHFRDEPFTSADVVICTIPEFDVAIKDTGRLLACFAKKRLNGRSLQSQCFNVHAFWKALIGISKMVYFVCWVFRINIESNVRRIHPGIEVFEKDFS